MATGGPSAATGGKRPAPALLHVHYVSNCLVPAAEIEREIGAIVRTSRDHNDRMGITGALVYARGWFTQVLEGPALAVDALMQRIECDHRHQDCSTIQRRVIALPAFSRWSLAYRGGSVFVASAIESAAAGVRHGRVAETHTLVRLMAEFARTLPPPPA